MLSQNVWHQSPSDPLPYPRRTESSSALLQKPYSWKFLYSIYFLQPRYIQSLLKQAERRKREQERRLEREIQKEREAEGEEFKDKEEFITSAYRKKLEEFEKLDEEERRQDQIDGWCKLLLLHSIKMCVLH